MFNIVLGYIADQEYHSAAFEASKQVTTKYTELRAIDVTNQSGGTLWVQLWNSANAGVAGTIVGTYPLPTNSTLSVTDKRFPAGLYVRGSATPTGAVASADLWISASYTERPLI